MGSDQHFELKEYNDHSTSSRRRIVPTISELADIWHRASLPVLGLKVIKNGLLCYFRRRKLQFLRQISLKNIHENIASSISRQILLKKSHLLSLPHITLILTHFLTVPGSGIHIYFIWLFNMICARTLDKMGKNGTHFFLGKKPLRSDFLVTL